MAKTISIEALKVQDISIDTGIRLTGKSLKVYYLTGRDGIRNQVQSRVETSGNLLVSFPSLPVGKYSLIVTDGRMTIYVVTISAIDPIESTVTKEFIDGILTGEVGTHTHTESITALITKAYIEEKLTGEVSSHTHTNAITALVTKAYIEGLLTGQIASHNHPSSTFTYFT